jgi:hypothetical protein
VPKLQAPDSTSNSKSQSDSQDFKIQNVKLHIKSFTDHSPSELHRQTPPLNPPKWQQHAFEKRSNTPQKTTSPIQQRASTKKVTTPPLPQPPYLRYLVVLTSRSHPEQEKLISRLTTEDAQKTSLYIVRTPHSRPAQRSRQTSPFSPTHDPLSRRKYSCSSHS